MYSDKIVYTIGLSTAAVTYQLLLSDVGCGCQSQRFGEEMNGGKWQKSPSETSNWVSAKTNKSKALLSDTGWSRKLY